MYPIYPARGIYIFFCVSFIKHLRLNKTGMRSDKHSPHARLSQVDPYLHYFSTACFSRFSLPLINQRSKFEFQMLKTFLFHILHVTQSRVSIGLTVSRKSVKKLAARRKTWQIVNPLLLKKLTLKIIYPTMCYLVLFTLVCYLFWVSRSRKMATILTVSRKKFLSVGSQF